MPMFPRFKDFQFQLDTTYTIPPVYTGRGDLISIAIYGDYKYYKPLCAYNDINLPYGVRTGIRPLEESIRSELRIKGLSNDQIDEEVDIYFSNAPPGSLDWNGYSDFFSGYISDLYEGRILAVPTVESCNEWLRRFEKLI